MTLTTICGWLCCFVGVGRYAHYEQVIRCVWAVPSIRCFLRAFLPFPCVSLLAYLPSCFTTTNQVPGFFPHFLDSF